MRSSDERLLLAWLMFAGLQFGKTEFNFVLSVLQTAAEFKFIGPFIWSRELEYQYQFYCGQYLEHVP